jgi:hypothetical protein
MNMIKTSGVADGELVLLIISTRHIRYTDKMMMMYDVDCYCC